MPDDTTVAPTPPVDTLPVPPAPPPEPEPITAEEVLAGKVEKDETVPITPDSLSEFDLSKLLSHPTIGPQLQSWADRSARTQIDATLASERSRIASDAHLDALETHFDALTQDELAEELARDPKAVDAYAAVKQHKENRGKVGLESQITSAAQVYAYATEIQVYNGLLEGSGLATEELAKLKAENFTHLGPTGITVWGKAVQTALVEHRAKALLDERWEAYKQEQLVGLDGKPPELNGGQPRRSIKLSREVLKNMAPEEILKLPQEDVDKVLSGN